MAQRPLLVLYGTQTGTTEGFAKVVASFARVRSFDVTLCKIDDYNHGGFEKLSEESLVLFLTCTFYNGEFPDNAVRLWHFLSEHHPADYLKKMSFAVFGLGNKTNKDNFNIAAKKLNQRLKDLGASELVSPGFGDEYDPNGHESAFRPWLRSVWRKLGADTVKPCMPCVVEVCEDVSTEPQLPEGFVRVPVLSNELLTKGYQRPAFLLSLDLSQAHQASFQLCDHVMVMPINNPDLVNRLAKRLKLPLDAVIRIRPLPGAAMPGPLPPTLKLRDLLTSYLDISAIPSRALIEALSFVAADKKEAESLENLAADMLPGNEFAKRTLGDVFSVVDLLDEFKSLTLTASQLISNLPLITPRYYSLCSAPAVDPNTLQLSYMVDQWQGKVTAREFRGLCSSYMSTLAPKQFAHVKVTKGLFKVPSVDKPLLCVALGTGVAVFRGLLQDRQAAKRLGARVGKVLLYYGLRHMAQDFLFAAELKEFEREGLVELVASASHDQSDFITPATKIAQAPDKAWSVLNSGGSYLYCGLGGLVPDWIESAVYDAVVQCGDMGDAAATAYMSKLKAEGRWQVEAYSAVSDIDNALKDIAMRKGGKGQSVERPIADQFAGSKMFCFQCEQTFQGRGCTTIGICGKTPEVASLQDLIIHEMKKLSWFAHELRQLQARGLDAKEVEDDEANRFSLVATFATLTNVNFDPEALIEYIQNARRLAKRLQVKYSAGCAKLGVVPRISPIPDTDETGTELEELVRKGKDVGLLARFRATKDDSVVGLQEMLVYGLKGLCAYTEHAEMFGFHSKLVTSFVHEAYAFLLTQKARKLENLLPMLLRCGEVNITALDMLHNANATLGTQSPAKTRNIPVPGKCILISGHDLKIMEELLKATEGKGINIYTHGEMLPAHGYPKLRAFSHFVGHYGVGWQRQGVEFKFFPGPVLMTTNCLTPPKDDYKDRLFTMNAVGWSGCAHLPGHGSGQASFDFQPIISKALEMPGFTEADKVFAYPDVEAYQRMESFEVGYAHEVVLGAAETVLKAVSAGQISRFFVIGGCDGFEGERSYYTDLAKILPETAVVLTCGCGKYRVNQVRFKHIGDTGIPRLLDLGQCNDAYSAVRIALGLAEALKCGVNDLPLSIVLSWFEQKAVVVLLSLLHLGIKNIRVGPSLPAFIRPSVMQVLVDKFGIKPVGDPTVDLNAMMAGKGTA